MFVVHGIAAMPWIWLAAVVLQCPRLHKNALDLGKPKRDAALFVAAAGIRLNLKIFTHLTRVFFGNLAQLLPQ